MANTPTDLEIQLGSITPENLKGKESIDSLMALYGDNFDDLQYILENPLKVLDTDFLIEKYEETQNEKLDNVRKELFSIHLQEIYKTFSEIGDSEEIYNKFLQINSSLGLPTDELKIVAEIDKTINSEYINASTSYKTKKGTRSGFFYVYDIINRAGIQSINVDEFFKLIEGTKDNAEQPYAYSIETSLYKEVYDKTVVPLAHPVGFEWAFYRLVFLTLLDYFGLEETKTLTELSLSCYTPGTAVPIEEEIVMPEEKDDNGDTTKEAINLFGLVKHFETDTDTDKNEEIIVDFSTLNDEPDEYGIRIRREFNGQIAIFDRQDSRPVSFYGELLNLTSNTLGTEHPLYNDRYLPEYDGQIEYLEIEDVRLVDLQNGLLTVNYAVVDLMGEEFQVVESIDFVEYTIIDREFVTVEFKVKGGREDDWTTSKVKLESKAVNLEEPKFFEAINFSRKEMLDASFDYNGRLLVNKGDRCRLVYKVESTFKIITTDISDYVRNTRPEHSLANYKSTVADIYIDPDILKADLLAGRDPYEAEYSSLDHTVEETNYYNSYEFWPRLAFENKIPVRYVNQTGLDPALNTGHLAPEEIVDPDTGDITYLEDGFITDVVVGGNHIVANYAIHPFDMGWDEITGEPLHYTRPASLEDLALVNSTNSVERYEADNTEYEGEYSTFPLGNNIYAAWEDYSMDVSVTMFKDQEYAVANSGDALPIGSSLFIIGEGVFIGSGNDSYKVDAEVYRAQWNFINEEADFERAVFSINPYFSDEYNLYEEIIEGYSNVYSPTDTDEYWDLEGDLFVSNDPLIAIDAGEADYRVGNVEPVIDDDDTWSFGVFRYNEMSLEWEVLTDNNVSAA